MSELANRTAIVTGAAMGIGRAGALKLAQAGAAVTVADIDTAQGEKTASDIKEAGGRAIFVPTDVRSFSRRRASHESDHRGLGTRGHPCQQRRPGDRRGG